MSEAFFAQTAKRAGAQMREKFRYRLWVKIREKKVPIMNTLTNQVPSLYTDFHKQLVKAMSEPNELPLPATPIPTEEKALRGYDLLMRRHAAACEAGR